MDDHVDDVAVDDRTADAAGSAPARTTVRPASAPAESAPPGQSMDRRGRRAAGRSRGASPRPSVPAQRSARPVIRRLELSGRALDVVAVVGLDAGAQVVEGRGEGAATPGGVHRAVAAATVRAAQQVAGGVRLDVVHVEVVGTAPAGRTVLVQVEALDDDGAQRLVGAAPVRDDVRAAVVRACLDAVNRRLGTPA